MMEYAQKSGDEMVSAEVLKVKDFMEKKYEKVEIGDTLSSFIGRLKNKDIQEAVVVKGKRAAGVISYDMLIKRRNIPLYAKVEHLMMSPPEVSPENSFIEACEVLFSSGLRVVPVEEKKKLVAVLTRRSVMKVVPDVEELAHRKAGEIMSGKPVVVREKDDAMRVKDIMNRHDIRAVPVVNERKELIGVVGLKDIATLLIREKERASLGEHAGRKEKVEIPVDSIMHRNPIFVGADATLADVARLMTKHKIGGIVITEGKEPVGIVHQIDLIEAGANLAPREGVYIQISGSDDLGDVYNEMYEIIEKYLKRIAEMNTPRMLNIHIVHHHDHEGTNYTLRLRMSTDKKTYYATFTEWNIFRALTEALEDLERQVLKDKERALDERKRRTRA